MIIILCIAFGVAFIATTIAISMIMYCFINEWLKEDSVVGFSESLTQQISNTLKKGEKLRLSNQELRERCYMGTKFIKDDEFKV